MILRILAASLLALGLGLATENAHAAQTFVCADGRLLQVELDDLERMKRDEPCVAASYGIAIQNVPLPVKRPALPPLPVLKGSKAAAKSRPETTQVAHSSVNYRTVRIINARPGEPAWFKHDR